MAGVISVGVVDDDAMLMEGMCQWFERVPDVSIVSTAPSVGDCLAWDQRPDVTLLDLNLRDHSDPAANVRQLVQAGHRVLMVSTIPDAEHVIATVEAGAVGYVTKNNDLAALVGAIREAFAGGLTLTPELAFVFSNDRRAERPALSPREREVLRDYAGGMKLEAVARKLRIAPGTVRTHLARIKEKYAAAGRPAYTKLELAERLREDRLDENGLGSTDG